MLGHGALLAAAGAGKTVGSYRYVRIYITANNGNSYTTIQEIELATTSGGPDITVPGMAVGQSVGDFTGAIDNLFDGATPTQMWQNPNTFPMWGYVDLGAQFPVVELRMQGQNYATTQNSRSPMDFKVQGSNDAVAWTDIKSFSGVTGWVAATWKTFALY